MSISNDIFYENKLTTDADVQTERDEDNLKADIWEDHKKTVTWCDIQAKESRAKDSYSTKNDGEADYVVKLVKELVANSNGIYQLGDIAC